MAFIEPPNNIAVQNTWIQDQRKAVMAFEVGRNKTEMGEYEAPEEKSDPRPGDAAKIIRDLRFGGLKVGYILEFFDSSKNGNAAKARKIAQELSEFLDSIQGINCRVAIVALTSEGNPLSWLYPSYWRLQEELNYERIDFGQSTPSDVISYVGTNIDYEFKEKCEKLWEEEPDFTIVQGTVGSSARHKNKPRLWFLPEYFQVAPQGKGNELYEALLGILHKYYSDEVRGQSRIAFTKDFPWSKFKDFIGELKRICERQHP